MIGYFRNIEGVYPSGRSSQPRQKPWQGELPGPENLLEDLNEIDDATYQSVLDQTLRDLEYLERRGVFNR